MMVQLNIGKNGGRTDIYNLLQQQQGRVGGNNSAHNSNGFLTVNKDSDDSSCLSVDDRLASVSSSRILNETIRFVPASQRNEFNSQTLKRKYIYLKPSSSSSEAGEPWSYSAKATTNCHRQSNGGDRDVKDDIPKPQVEIYPANSIKLWWDHTFPVPAGSGLKNLGNTCFMNSVLQVMTYTPPLHRFLIEETHQCASNTLNFCPLCLLAGHMRSAVKGSNNCFGCYSPSSFVNKLRMIMKSYQFGRQEDAHELLRYLIDSMQNALLLPFKNRKLDMYSKETTPVSRIFGGFFRNEIVCMQCKVPSITFDPFYDVSLDIKKASTIVDALADFTKPELLQDSNAYSCPNCKRKTSAKKQYMLYRLPTVLTFQLKRFDHFGKIAKHVAFPETLDVSSFTWRPAENNFAPLIYKLYGVIVHMGMSTHSGHYFAFVRGNGSWYLMDDARVCTVGIGNVKNANAYLLFYIRQADPSSPSPQAAARANVGSAVSSVNRQQQQQQSFKPVVGPQQIPNSINSMNNNAKRKEFAAAAFNETFGPPVQVTNPNANSNVKSNSNSNGNPNSAAAKSSQAFKANSSLAKGPILISASNSVGDLQKREPVKLVIKTQPNLLQQQRKAQIQHQPLVPYGEENDESSDSDSDADAPAQKKQKLENVQEKNSPKKQKIEIGNEFEAKKSQINFGAKSLEIIRKNVDDRNSKKDGNSKFDRNSKSDADPAGNPTGNSGATPKKTEVEKEEKVQNSVAGSESKNSKKRRKRKKKKRHNLPIDESKVGTSEGKISCPNDEKIEKNENSKKEIIEKHEKNEDIHHHHHHHQAHQEHSYHARLSADPDPVPKERRKSSGESSRTNFESKNQMNHQNEISETKNEIPEMKNKAKNVCAVEIATRKVSDPNSVAEANKKLFEIEHFKQQLLMQKKAKLDSNGEKSSTSALKEDVVGFLHEKSGIAGYGRTVMSWNGGASVLNSSTTPKRLSPDLDSADEFSEETKKRPKKRTNVQFSSSGAEGPSLNRFQQYQDDMNNDKDY